MPRAMIYVRLSRETENTTSPARQEEECRKWCADHGHDVVEVVKDLDVSGSNKGLRLDRPGLRSVRDRWAEVDVLVFAKLDRIARNVQDWTRLAEEAKAHGVALVSVTDNLDLTDPRGVFIANVLQSFAELEAGMVSSRVTESTAYLAREGRYRGGRLPYGWVAAKNGVGQGFRLVLDPPAAEILRDAVARTIAGEPTTRIVKEYNATGTPGPDGKGWGTATLKRMLRRPVMRGMLVYRGEVVRGAEGLPIRPNEPLLTDDEWRDLQRALDARTHPGGYWKRPPHLLTGLAVCGLCGQPLHTSASPKRALNLKCSMYERKAVPCTGVAILLHKLEPYVVETLLGVLGDVEVTQEEKIPGAGDALLEIEEALDAVTRQLRDVEEDEVEERLLETRRVLVRRRRELRAMPEVPKTIVHETGETFGQVWARTDLEGRRGVLASVLEEVRVNKGVPGGWGQEVAERVEIVWKGAERAT